MICELSIDNLTGETKYLTPWVHLSFDPWPGTRFVAVDGKDEGYAETDIYWGGHPAQAGKPLRLVLTDGAGKMSVVFGASPDHLLGVSGMLPVSGEFHQASAELRYDTLALGSAPALARRQLPGGHRGLAALGDGGAVRAGQRDGTFRGGP